MGAKLVAATGPDALPLSADVAFVASFTALYKAPNEHVLGYCRPCASTIAASASMVWTHPIRRLSMGILTTRGATVAVAGVVVVAVTVVVVVEEVDWHISSEVPSVQVIVP